MRKVVVSWLLASLLVLALSGTVFANTGGVPNERAAWGQSHRPGSGDDSVTIQGRVGGGGWY